MLFCRVSFCSKSQSQRYWFGCCLRRLSRQGWVTQLGHNSDEEIPFSLTHLASPTKNIKLFKKEFILDDFKIPIKNDMNTNFKSLNSVSCCKNINERFGVYLFKILEWIYLYIYFYFFSYFAIIM